MKKPKTIKGRIINLIDCSCNIYLFIFALAVIEMFCKGKWINFAPMYWFAILALFGVVFIPNQTN